MRRQRCCGRWCFWRVPLGPWCCSAGCDRTYFADVPRCHRARFWEAIDELVAQVPPLTGDELSFVRRVFGFRTVRR